MQIFKNKFFIVCLCVAVVVCAVPSVFSIMGYKSLSRDIVGILTTPFRFCATAVVNAAEGFERFFTSIDALHEQNEQLRQENELLRDALEDAELAKAENDRLRGYLGMKKQNPSFTFEEGMVLSFSSGNYVTGYTLNKGTAHGIEVNMAVVHGGCIVGYVSEVGTTWCKVSTLIETASSVGAYVRRSGATGIVSGDFDLSRDGYCKFSYVESDADIAVGDKIYSTGMGSVYPAELEIGQIVSIDADEYSRTLVATVKPSADLASIKHLLIVTGFEEVTQTTP